MCKDIDYRYIDVKSEIGYCRDILKNAEVTPNGLLVLKTLKTYASHMSAGATLSLAANSKKLEKIIESKTVDMIAAHECNIRKDKEAKDLYTGFLNEIEASIASYKVEAASFVEAVDLPHKKLYEGKILWVVRLASLNEEAVSATDEAEDSDALGGKRDGIIAGVTESSAALDMDGAENPYVGSELGGLSSSHDHTDDL